ncbi:MAG TPA: hypothetical protein VN896_12280 [Methylomirabilota bacterium]|nr:hypothetical protein [Methylomirabilota bacterium]
MRIGKVAVEEQPLRTHTAHLVYGDRLLDSRLQAAAQLIAVVLDELRTLQIRTVLDELARRRLRVLGAAVVGLGSELCNELDGSARTLDPRVCPHCGWGRVSAASTCPRCGRAVGASTGR